MLFDQSFKHNYECRLIESPPMDGSQKYCYPGGIAGGWVHGIGVEITPHSNTEMWIGSFANGEISPNAVSGVFSHPSPNKLLVIARGDGHVVNVDVPTDYVWLDKVVPIMGALPLPNAGLIVLNDFVRLTALGPKGIAWRSPCLSWDGLAIENVADGVIYGFGWDSPNNCNVPFEVNALSGAFKGGASPELLGIR